MSQTIKLENTKIKFANVLNKGEYKGESTGYSISVVLSDQQAADLEKSIAPLQALGFQRSPLRPNLDKDGNDLGGKMVKVGLRTNAKQRASVKFSDPLNHEQEPRFGQLVDLEVELDTYSTPAIGKGVSIFARKAIFGKMPERSEPTLDISFASDSLDV